MCALPLVASLMASAKDPMKNKGQVLPYLREEVNQLSDTCTEGQVCTVPEASRLTTHLEQYHLPCIKNKHSTLLEDWGTTGLPGMPSQQKDNWLAHVSK